MTAPLTIRLHADDNVVVARTDIVAGTPIPGESVTTAAYIPAGHKLVVRAIGRGEPGRKYNQTLRFPTMDRAGRPASHTADRAHGAGTAGTGGVRDRRALRRQDRWRERR